MIMTGLRRTALLVIVSVYLTACGSLPESDATRLSTDSQHPGNRVAAWAQQMIGTPYQFGGNSPSGFDCSGLVQYTYNQAGLEVPRTTREQYRKAKRIRYTRLQAGDLVFFRLEDGKKISHVGIYIGDGQMIHAPSTGKLVSYASIENGYWRKRIIHTGRFY